ncbi:MAG: NAD(+)/NADH kinase [Fibrobacter sp.]|nr:NAD(+)/NADH kinase [Fibrobacter sp.]
MQQAKTIFLVAWSENNQDLQDILQRIVKWQEKQPQISILVNENLQKHNFDVASEEQIKSCDAMVAIGGDGTMLSAARMALGTDIPLLGINTGRIGFLTDFTSDELENALNLIVSGNFSLDKRAMLDFEIFAGDKLIFTDTALNEVQIEAILPERMVDLGVSLNQQELTEYWADSLLISTPTGSTAYNLSAGGPILHPLTHTIVLNPVNPFTLTVRPLVIPADDSLIKIEECNAKPVRIWVNGRLSTILEPGQKLLLKNSPCTCDFIASTHNGFVDALREKLGWAGKPKLNQRSKLC